MGGTGWGLTMNDADTDLSMINRLLKMRFTIDERDNNEWCYPSGQPLDAIHLKECDPFSLQVFLGSRVMGAIQKHYFLGVFSQGKGYEYIEEWKNRHHIALQQLTGAQILRITDLLRSYGHSGGNI